MGSVSQKTWACGPSSLIIAAETVPCATNTGLHHIDSALHACKIGANIAVFQVFQMCTFVNVLLHSFGSQAPTDFLLCAGHLPF